ncbi:unnamed protein product, partial [Allacma fusca]
PSFGIGDLVELNIIVV